MIQFVILCGRVAPQLHRDDSIITLCTISVGNQAHEAKAKAAKFKSAANIKYAARTNLIKFGNRALLS